LAWSGSLTGRRIFASGASENVIYEFNFQAGRVTAAGSIRSAPPSGIPAATCIENAGYVAGMALSPTASALTRRSCTAEGARDRLAAAQGRRDGRPARPSRTRASCRRRQTLFVSVWGGAKVVHARRVDAREKGEIAVGEHPNAMALSRDGTRLFVACANTNAVWVVRRRQQDAGEQISVALGRRRRPDRRPTASRCRRTAARSPIANADNNTVTWPTCRQPGRTRRRDGSRRLVSDRRAVRSRRRRLFVLDGKGLTGWPTRAARSRAARASTAVLGAMFQGASRSIPVPDAARWRA
jgi:hypothetical protein